MREPAVGGQVILLQRRFFAASHLGAIVRSKRKGSAETRIKISIAKSLLQRCERWLASAVARCDAFDFECIFESRHSLCDNLIRGDDKVEAAGNDMNLRIDSRRCLHNLVNSRMRASDDQYHALRGADRKG